MGRQNLGALLGNVDDKPEPLAPTPPPEPHADKREPDEPSAAAAAPPPRTATPSRTLRPAFVEPELPTYLRLVRKETRLREDQQNQLTLHARRLNRAKAAGTPRLTDNSLIRVAVDLLLTRIDKAAGDTEAAILESLNP